MHPETPGAKVIRPVTPADKPAIDESFAFNAIMASRACCVLSFFGHLCIYTASSIILSYSKKYFNGFN
jgi:hypothetical protein